MRTGRMRREGRGTSSADPPPPLGPGRPRMGLHQVGTLMYLFRRLKTPAHAMQGSALGSLLF